MNIIQRFKKYRKYQYGGDLQLYSEIDAGFPHSPENLENHTNDQVKKQNT